jgi:MFS family permease
LFRNREVFPRQFWLIAGGVLVASAGSSLVWPFQFIYITRVLGLRLSAVATLITLSAGVGLLMSFAAGPIADRVGRKPVMVMAQAAQGLAWLLMARAHSYLGFLLPLTLLSASLPIYAVGSDAMMADLLPAEQRSSGYSILRMANNAGIALGPGIGGFIVSRSYFAGFCCAAGALLAYSLFLLLRVRETRPGHRPEEGARAQAAGAGFGPVLSDRGFMVFAGLMTLGLTATLMLWTLLAVYTKQNFGFPEHLYGWLPMTNALMCVLVQYSVTRFTRQRRNLSMLTLGMLVYSVGVGSVALMSSFWGFWLSMVVFSLGELIVVPTGTAFVANRAPKEARGRYMNIYWATWGLARATAPLVGGLLNDHISPHAVWYGGFLIGVAATGGLFLLGRRPALAGKPARDREMDQDLAEPAAESI